MWLLTLIVFIIMLGLLVLVHEFGHFIMAKKFGVHIYEFSIGMGPVIHKHIGKDKIQYSIRAFPIGGFVQMAGEVGEDDEKIAKKKFMCNKPWWQRIIILCAGVFNNFILALILLFLLALIWGSNTMEPKITEVVSDSAMEIAGAKAGDVIISVDNHQVKTWDKAQIYLVINNGKDYYDIRVRHENGTEENLKVAPTITKDEKGNETRVFGMQISSEVSYGIIPALRYAVTKTNSIIESMYIIIGALVTGHLSLSSLSGPVGIYNVVGQSISYGFSQVIYLTAYLSLNLAVVNLLPFPAFDGGHVLFVIIERIKGSPVNRNVEGYFHTIGFILLMILMLIITCHDIIRLF